MSVLEFCEYAFGRRVFNKSKPPLKPRVHKRTMTAHYKLSLDQEMNLVRQFNSGVPIKKLARDYNIYKITVLKIIERRSPKVLDRKYH